MSRQMTSSGEESISVINGLTGMGKEDIVDKKSLAQIFQRCTTSIDRAVKRGELPPPIRIMGKARWTVGAIQNHLEKLQKIELEKQRIREERLADFDYLDPSY